MKISDPIPMKRRPKQFGSLTSDLEMTADDVSSLVNGAVNFASGMFSKGADFARQEFTNAGTLNIDGLVGTPVQFVSGSAQDTGDFLSQNYDAAGQLTADAAQTAGDAVSSVFNSILWLALIVGGGIAVFYYLGSDD